MSETQTTKDQYILKQVKSMHSKAASQGGTNGYCSECDLLWPCPTYHIADGHGPVYDCEDAKWCDHLGVPLL